jgi:hypothetical protein
VTQSPTGDTCVANGIGTSYQLLITVPSAAPQQGGFAFGSPGIKVTNIDMSDNAYGGGGGIQGGALSTRNLPPNTTAAWLLGTPPAGPGASITATLRTSGPATGSFTVVPANTQHTAYFDPFSCTLTKPASSNKFTVKAHFTYIPAAGTWRSFVTVPGPGLVTFKQSNGTTKPLIHGGKISLKGPSTVRLSLEPTAAGNAALKATGSIKLKLSVEFTPTNGKPAGKILTLSLTK